MMRGTWRATCAPPLREAGKPARRKRRCRATPGVRSAWLQSKGIERCAERVLSRHTPTRKSRDPASERRREMTTDSGRRPHRFSATPALRLHCVNASFVKDDERLTSSFPVYKKHPEKRLSKLFKPNQKKFDSSFSFLLSFPARNIAGKSNPHQGINGPTIHFRFYYVSNDK
ncbi:MULTISPECIES: hypothetical protein [Burkholderia]|uniref:hypothetical protein n=1 Tax=Burkholderia TaxID=32008 RepID=UPI000A8B6555|nr:MULTISPECIES: hypothetical protein [Burkholderia]